MPQQPDSDVLLTVSSVSSAQGEVEFPINATLGSATLRYSEAHGPPRGALLLGAGQPGCPLPRVTEQLGCRGAGLRCHGAWGALLGLCVSLWDRSCPRPDRSRCSLQLSSEGTRPRQSTFRLLQQSWSVHSNAAAPRLVLSPATLKSAGSAAGSDAFLLPPGVGKTRKR